MILQLGRICALLALFADGASADPDPASDAFLERLRQTQTDLATVRPITRGPKSHWFGYYDKFQFDPTERFVLGMEADFDHRSPTRGDVIKIGMIDIEDDDRWTELGESRAWCWQQGCMLQWRPGAEDEILWNDRNGAKLVCHILNVKTNEKRTVQHAVYHVSPDGRWGLGLDFVRLGEMDRGYGYWGPPDPNRGVLAPDDSTIYLVDLETGQRRELISAAAVARILYSGATAGDKHYFNHIQWAPNGKRLLFLNRWNRPGTKWTAGTRMFTLNPAGRDLRLVNVGSSHFEWRNDEQILIWVNDAYRLFQDDGSAGPGEVVWRAPNGHQSYLPDREWLVTDTYPRGQNHEQHVYLHHVPTGRDVLLGAFYVPSGFSGEWRCDTHPRISRSGNKVVIDSTHGGDGRQMYLIDVERVIGQL
jgi:hypothetical protein